MSFQHIQYRRVIMGVVTIFGVSFILSLLSQCLVSPFMPAEIGERTMDLFETVNDEETTPEKFDAERERFWSDFGRELTIQYAMQWFIVALVTFIMAQRIARRAATREQAIGYGVLIGIGVIASYGLLCSCLPAIYLAPNTLFPLAVIFWIVFAMAGYLGGRSVSNDLQPTPAAVTFGSAPHAPQSQAASGDVAMYYNMGVQAALGGRREEARQHFSRVLQGQPRNLAAWLQLANLADTPQDAWQYVQQARAINPSDPAVLQAVDIIWPQVAQSAAQQGPPASQLPGASPAHSAPRVPGSALDEIFDAAPVPTPAAPPDAAAEFPAAPPPGALSEAPTFTDLPSVGTQPPAEVTEAPTAIYDVSAYAPTSFDVSDDDASVNADVVDDTPADTDAASSGEDVDEGDAESDTPPPPPPEPDVS
ncbi:MAG: hypothetical protein K8S97_11630 [Anaerolineae bacterium]|nr:hypothetical protein [Anaerolineae bacterium]